MIKVLNQEALDESVMPEVSALIRKRVKEQAAEDIQPWAILILTTDGKVAEVDPFINEEFVESMFNAALFFTEYSIYEITIEWHWQTCHGHGPNPPYINDHHDDEVLWETEDQEVINEYVAMTKL